MIFPGLPRQPRKTVDSTDQVSSPECQYDLWIISHTPIRVRNGTFICFAFGCSSWERVQAEIRRSVEELGLPQSDAEKLSSKQLGSLSLDQELAHPPSISVTSCPGSGECCPETPLGKLYPPLISRSLVNMTLLPTTTIRTHITLLSCPPPQHSSLSPRPRFNGRGNVESLLFQASFQPHAICCVRLTTPPINTLLIPRQAA